MDLILVIVIPLLAIILSIIITTIVTDHINKTHSETVENNKNQNKRYKSASAYMPIRLVNSIIKEVHNVSENRMVIIDELYLFSLTQSFDFATKLLTTLEEINAEENTAYSVSSLWFFETYVFYASYIIRLLRSFYSKTFGEIICGYVDFNKYYSDFFNRFLEVYYNGDSTIDRATLSAVSSTRFTEYFGFDDVEDCFAIFETICSHYAISPKSVFNTEMNAESIPTLHQQKIGIEFYETLHQTHQLFIEWQNETTPIMLDELKKGLPND